ncbi:winged helix-turn-helix transcriptional regulator [Chryseolinea lacunae]|uniref:Helix-turn-helix transcriptional regulator n=1 Tax=Chryseolinea lacunae TaxID=2801331 RepID=A0ABS1L226_9BACT|nr:helix-turn-helix domain-containing protein [Chryseolinea lacunae]MBL0745498.1 helix-turn-helix transcriptional regulator [Chryseolinea lacunae]
MSITIVDNQPVARQKKIETILKETRKSNGVCPVQGFLEHIGSKWAMMVILNLGYSGKTRFNELKGRVAGISQRMLTVTLRSLEENGLVTRKVFPEIPPRVEYDLTPLGKSLLDVMMSLGDWAVKHETEINTARKKFAKA